MLTFPRGSLGVLVVVWSSLSCAIWLVGCSRDDAQADRDQAAANNQETTSRQASVQSIESLLVSADNQIVASVHRKVPSSDQREQIAGLIRTSTVLPHGIRRAEPVGGIPPPLIPPPRLILWVVDGKASPTHVEIEEVALAVFEVYVDHGASFAQARQPGKSGRFIFESDGWQTFTTTIVND